MSVALFDYIQAVKPSLGDEKRAKISLLIHYITPARVSGGGVKMDNVLTTSGNSFVLKVLGNIPVPEGLRRLCAKYNIDVEACIRRNKNFEKARSEMRDLVIFVRLAMTVMAALHEDTLRHLDDSYRGHRPAGYKPKSKWFGLGTDNTVPPVLARGLPGARPPRAVGLKPNPTPAPTPKPVSMARKISEESSQSSSSSGSNSTHKRPAVHPSVAPRSNPPYGFVPSPVPMAISSPAAYYAQCAAMVAYYHTMQQGMTSQRGC